MVAMRMADAVSTAVTLTVWRQQSWGRIEDLINGGFQVHLIDREIEMMKKPEASKEAADKLVKSIRHTYSAP